MEEQFTWKMEKTIVSAFEALGKNLVMPIEPEDFKGVIKRLVQVRWCLWRECTLAKHYTGFRTVTLQLLTSFSPEKNKNVLIQQKQSEYY
jgi:hypothetical protein